MVDEDPTRPQSVHDNLRIHQRMVVRPPIHEPSGHEVVCHVTGSDRDPIEGAEVFILDERLRELNRGTTDATGIAHLVDTQDSAWLAAVAEGFAPTFIPIRGAPPYYAILRTAENISGQVVDIDLENGISGISMTFRLSPDRISILGEGLNVGHSKNIPSPLTQSRAISDYQGKFTAGGLVPGGLYEFSMDLGGLFYSLVRPVQGKAFPAGTDDLTVSLGRSDELLVRVVQASSGAAAVNVSVCLEQLSPLDNYKRIFCQTTRETGLVDFSPNRLRGDAEIQISSHEYKDKTTHVSSDQLEITVWLEEADTSKLPRIQGTAPGGEAPLIWKKDGKLYSKVTENLFRIDEFGTYTLEFKDAGEYVVAILGDSGSLCSRFESLTLQPAEVVIRDFILDFAGHLEIGGVPADSTVYLVVGVARLKLPLVSGMVLENGDPIIGGDSTDSSTTARSTWTFHPGRYWIRISKGEDMWSDIPISITERVTTHVQSP